MINPRHSSMHGQPEQVNHMLEEATGRRSHYDDHQLLRTRLADFIAAYNYGRLPDTLYVLMPFEAICRERHHRRIGHVIHRISWLADQLLDGNLSVERLGDRRA